MAARRLVAVLIVMLVLSTVAAVLVPAPRRPIGSSTTTTSTRSTTARPAPGAGKLVTATMNTQRRRGPVNLRVGDELRLRVVSNRSDQVKIDGFGLVEAVDASAPALFDLFADHAGQFDVTLLDSGDTVGRIVIRRQG
jgi:hypothetical protein